MSGPGERSDDGTQPTVEPAQAYWQQWQEGTPPDLDRFLEHTGPLTPIHLAGVVCVDLRERWRRQDRVGAEQYLRRFPDLAADREAALDVAYCEFLVRADFGETPTAAEFTARFPDLEPELGRHIALHHVLEDGSDGYRTVPPGLTSNPEARSGSLALTPGARLIEDYELVRLLGRGGFGEVWHAAGPGGFDVALKIIQRESRAGSTELRSLEVVKRIHHPNLLGLFGAWERGPFLIVAMELADSSLWDRLEAATRKGSCGIAPAELLEYMREAAKGIDHLNQLGIQHRDVKPQNLLLAGGGVKVGDFGLAKLLEASHASHTGAMSVAYAAPEFFESRTSATSDQYSLAVTYCQLRGGRLPFTGSMAEVMAGHLTRAPDLSMVAGEEHAVLGRALAKEPGERWPSCPAFVDALAAAAIPTSGPRATTVAFRPAQPRPPTSKTPVLPDLDRSSSDDRGRVGLNRWGSRGKVVAASIAAIALAAVLVLGFVGIFGHRETEATRLADGSLGRRGGTEDAATVPKTAPPRQGSPDLAKAPFGEAQARLVQQACADRLGRQVEERVDLGAGVGMDFVLIPPGIFTMGSPQEEQGRVLEQVPKDSRDQVRDWLSREVLHEVTISRPFYLARYPVTQEQYQCLIGKNPSNFSAAGKGKERVRGLDTSRFPVENVSWHEAVACCRKLTEQTGRKAVLPSEAEWEYACRAGTTTPYSFGTELNGTQANCNGNLPFGTSTKGPFLERTCPVHSYQPNAFGLYGMHGNVWQWCRDGGDDYDVNVRLDPEGPAAGGARAVRGGSWLFAAAYSRSADRSRNEPDRRYEYVGFRVALRLD